MYKYIRVCIYKYTHTYICIIRELLWYLSWTQVLEQRTSTRQSPNDCILPMDIYTLYIYTHTNMQTYAEIIFLQKMMKIQKEFTTLPNKVT